MKKTILTLIFALTFCILSATPVKIGHVPGRDDLDIVRDGWKYGINNSRGDVIIACEYESIIPLKGSNSHFILSKGGRFGLADEHGSLILPIRFSYIHPELLGNKVLIQTGGVIADELTSNLTFFNNDPMHISSKGYWNVSKTSFIEASPEEWMPSVKRYAIGGKWGLADIRPNVAIIPPSYDVVGTVPDNSRYLVLGSNIGNSLTYNIYDTEIESFILPLKEKKQYSNIVLLRGGYATVNNEFVSLSDPEDKRYKRNVIYVADINDRYFIVNTGRNVVLMDKVESEPVDSDEDITHYKVNDANGDFALAEDGSWILYSDNKRIAGLHGEPSFFGCFAVDAENDLARVFAKGKMVSQPRNLSFAASEDGRTLYYINSASELVALDYDTCTERTLLRGCSGFRQDTELRYLSVKQISGWEDKCGIFDTKTGSVVVACDNDDAIVFPHGYYMIKTGSSGQLKRFEDPDFTLPCTDVRVLTFRKMPYCWISETGSPDSYALFSFEEERTLSDYAFTPVAITKTATNRNLEIIMSTGYDFIPYASESKIGFMNTDGSIAVEPAYNNVYMDFTEGFVKVISEGKVGFVNPYSKVQIPCIFQNATRFSEGRCLVQKNGLWGIAGMNGEVLVQNKYAEIGEYRNDLPWLRKTNFKDAITYGALDTASKPFRVEWLDSEGKTLCYGTLATPMISSRIVDALWDF